MKRLVLLAILAAPLRAATTYHVDVNSTFGACSDSSGQSGSQANPFCTWTYAATRVSTSGGDTVCGQPGTYTEGGFLLSGVTGSSGAITTFEPCNFTPVTSSTSLTIGTGTQTLTVSSCSGYANGMHVEVLNAINTADGYGRYMIGSVTSCIGSTLVANITSTSQGPAGPFASWTVSWPVIFQSGNINSARFRISSVSWFLIQGLTFTNIQDGPLIDTGSSKGTVQNLFIDNTGEYAMSVSDNSAFFLFQNNVITNIGPAHTDPTGECIYIGNSDAPDNTHDITFTHNNCWNFTESLECKGGTYNCVISYNSISAGLQYPSPSGNPGVIEIDEAVNYASNPNQQVIGNVVADNHIGIQCGTGCLIANNVVNGTDTSTWPACIWHRNGTDQGSPDTYPRDDFENTLTCGTGTAIGWVSNMPTVVATNNIGPSGTGGTGGSNNLAYNSSYFVNASIGNFNLLPGAPYIGAGSASTLSAVPTDQAGVTRPNPPSIGAFEPIGAASSSIAASASLAGSVAR